MKIDSIEYLEKTSQGIYCKLRYYNFWGLFKIREVFLEKLDSVYYPRVKFVNTGNIINGNFGDAVRTEIIRVYEKSK